MSWGTMKNNPFANKYKYVQDNNPSTSYPVVANKAGKYAKSALRSEYTMTHGTLNADYEKIMKGGCFYLPNFVCQTDDMTIFDNLKKEINMTGMVNWSKHFKHEDPTFSKTFNEVIERMAKHFGVEILQTRLNYYKDGSDYKPMHKDRHAYIVDAYAGTDAGTGTGTGTDAEKYKVREDFTMGASFGASRNLDFVHEESQAKFSFPQNNGDVFAFNAEINKKFLHGVPKVNRVIGERFSIIAWCKKK